jgi:hypothetical protein
MSSLSTEPDGSGHTSFHALLPTNDESPKPFSSTCGSTCDSPSDSKKVSSARRAQHGALTVAPPRTCKCSPRRPTSPSRIPTGRDALDEPFL